MDDNITQYVHINMLGTKATDTPSEYVILILFYSNLGYANVPQCYMYMYIASDVHPRLVTL